MSPWYCTTLVPIVVVRCTNSHANVVHCNTHHSNLVRRNIGRHSPTPAHPRWEWESHTRPPPGAKNKTIKRAIIPTAELSLNGSYINLHLSGYSPFGCVSRIRVTNLDSIGLWWHYRAVETSRRFLETVSPTLRALVERTREFLTTPVATEPTVEELAAAHRLMNQECHGTRD